MVALQIPIHLICAALFAWLVNWVGLIPWRKSAGAHWTERARLLWPVRFTAGLNTFILPPLLQIAQQVFFPDVPLWWLPNLAAAFFGAVLGCYPSDRELHPQLGFRTWRHQAVAGWGIRFAIWGVLIICCAFMPENFGWQTIVIAAAYLVLHFAIQWGAVLKYLRLVKFLSPPSERLANIVNATAAKMNMNVRATWEMDGLMANAFVLPTTRELVFATRLVEICTDEEVASICAHELAHLQEGKFVLAGRLAGSLATFPVIFIIPCIHNFGIVGLLLPYLGLFGISKYARWLSQRMEKRADHAALSEQLETGVYARALEKLYRENMMPAVNINDKQTHPHLYDRMLASGIAPEYPRPAKPKWLTWPGWICVFALGFLFALLVKQG